MDADGSNPRALTEKLDRAPSGMIWAPDGSGIYFTAENEGSRNLYFTSLKGDVRPVTKGAQVLTTSRHQPELHGRRHGHESPLKPNDIVTFDVRTPAIKQLTDVNGDVLAGKQLATTEEIWYTSVDGYRIQGWIVKPAGFDPAKKYPMMLEIHGGPHSMYNVGFNFARQDHAANGYVLLYTNPRGSTGYGSAFGNAIKNAYPGKDFDDLMAGVDTVVNRGYVDTNRLYVFGCSGGGVLTAWIVGHTDRFAAAASTVPGHRLAQLRGHDRRLQLVLQLREVPVGGSQRAPPALAAHVRRQREDADDADDRRERPAHADAARPRSSTRRSRSARCPRRWCASTTNGTAPARRRPTSCARSSTCAAGSRSTSSRRPAGG